MNKLWQRFDNYLLPALVGFIIAFTALYPKLPSIQVTHTWVYIRLEDFLILLTTLVWLIQILRRKVSLPKPEGLALVAYWIAGLVSLLYCLFLVSPHLLNFFPRIAELQYLRRIEYMVLFFIGFSAVKNKKDVYRFIAVLFVTVTGVILYGFGQKFYISLWHMFPAFFTKFPFCFPAFLTGNEEFAKGTPFCLSDASRITSTFGGHYDLAAYLVFVLPILIAVFIVAKQWYMKIVTAAIGIFAIILLNFTSSRTSFAAYIIGIVTMLILWKKKLWIVPVLVVSILAMLAFSSSTLQRFAKTIQPVQVLTYNNSASSLPSNLQTIIKKTKETVENKAPESPPPGTITIGNTEEKTPPVATKVTKTTPVTPVTTVTTVVTEAELKKLTVDLNKIEISTVSGSFLISKAYALDISFTTRFQGEWPRDISAFQNYPLLGQGYSSLTLASDNDYLRALGETGLIGTITFFFIFVVLGIYMKSIIPSVGDSVTKAYLFGLAGGVIGLLMNAILIDVFEASKVAEPLWILLGIGAGGLMLYQKKKINYAKEFGSFFTSPALVSLYMLMTISIVFAKSITNFFVGDDFTWLRWAASGTPGDIKKYFLDASGFFYRPITKTVMFILYQLFAFTPAGYHIFNLFLHLLVGIGVLLVARKILKNKYFAIIAGFLFLLLPGSFENVYWISTLSTNLEAVGVIYSIWALLKFRETKQWMYYIFSLACSIFAMWSYEGGIVVPLILLATDVWFGARRISKQNLLLYIPNLLIVCAYFLMRQLSHALSAGGDYSYNLSHLLPNFVGNFLGYLGMYIVGPRVLPWYTILRNGLKAYAFIIGLFILIGIILLIVTIVRDSSILKKQFKNIVSRNLIGYLSIMVIALLPFLGLGNIAPRYSYTGGIGFVLLVAYLLMQITIIWEKDRNKIIVYAVTVVCTILLLFNYIISLMQTNSDWTKAGNITSQTLKYFRADNASLPFRSVIYINNLPIRYGQAWVFPVGLSDGLWFIYRDPSLLVIKVSSVADAQKQKALIENPSYIFSFDKNLNVGEVQ